MKRTKAQEITAQLLELLFIASIIGFSYFIKSNPLVFYILCYVNQALQKEEAVI